MYAIEESWYGGRHPLTFPEHQEQINKQKDLLTEYREKTKADFNELKLEGETLDENDIFSEKNMQKARNFSERVFEASKKCCDGFVKVSRAVIESSIANLKSCGHLAPCKFVVAALGSVAKGEATPYSDLEYAFIVEQHDEYFTKLAVDSYFRIGNLGETPLKCFDISELQEDGGCTPYATDMVSGYKIDGITTWSGNIPTGNGKRNGQTLTFKVDELIEFCKKEAESKFVELADKSDMLSSTVVIYTNEGETSKLHEKFRKAKHEYELTKATKNKNVIKKRFESFKKDIFAYVFLPDFVEFQPPKNLKLEVKMDIFRYPTLLANNIKLCMGWNFCYPWDTFSNLHSNRFLSSENYQYINIVLALSIYMRTNAYLNQSSQIQHVSLSAYKTQHLKKLNQLPSNLFVILGCLLAPIKQSIHSTFKSCSDTSLDGLVHRLFKDVHVDKSDFLLKAEVYYFSERYGDALSELTKGIGVAVESISCSTYLSRVSQKSDSIRKYGELCCYLLYYTNNYKSAVDYVSWLNTQQNGVTLWKLLAAHCEQKLGDYKAVRELLDEVSILILATKPGIPHSILFFCVSNTPPFM